MATTVITVGDIDITDQVYYSRSNFLSQMGPSAGSCQIAISDPSLAEAFTIGARILLTIDGLNVWSGYLRKIRRVYPFDAFSPPTVRQFVLVGSEINILFGARSVYKQSDPGAYGPTYPAHTSDSTVFSDLFSDFIDLSGDDLDTSSLVDHIGNINEDQSANPIVVGALWGNTMLQMARLISPIWGINADRQLVWADVDQGTAPFAISDHPGSGEKGIANLFIDFDATEMANDALIVGAAGTSSGGVVTAHNTDPVSIGEHGLWQMGAVDFGLYKQNSVNRLASSWVDGSITQKRGHKDDRVTATCTMFETGLRPGMVVNLRSEVWDYDDNIPVRTMRITWSSPKDVRYDLQISHELDLPLTLFDPKPYGTVPGTTWPPLTWPPLPTLPPVVISQPGGCSDEICGITDGFAGRTAGPASATPGDTISGPFWGTADVGLTYDCSEIHPTPVDGQDGTSNAYVADGVGTLECLSHGTREVGYNARSELSGVSVGSEFNILMHITFSQFGTESDAEPFSIFTVSGSGSGNSSSINWNFIQSPSSWGTSTLPNVAIDGWVTSYEFSAYQEEFLTGGALWYRFIRTATEETLAWWADGDPEPTTPQLTHTFSGTPHRWSGPSAIAFFQSAGAGSGGQYGDLKMQIDYLEIEGVNRCSTSPFALDIVNKSPNFYWRLYQTGSTLTDETGHQDMSIHGTITQGVTGPLLVGGAGVHQTSDNYAYAPGGIMRLFGNGPQTYMAWIKPDAIGGNQAILSQHVGSGYIRLNGANLQLVRSNQATIGSVGTTAISAGVWTHVAWTYDGSNGNWRFYVNGVAESDQTADPNLSPGNSDLMVGRDAFGENMAGAFAEVAIWGRTLSSVEIASIYAKTSMCAMDCGCGITDDFDRTVAAGFGTASSGVAWEDGTDGQSSVAGTYGRIMVPSGDGSYMFESLSVPTDPPMPQSFDITFQINFASVDWSGASYTSMTLNGSVQSAWTVISIAGSPRLYLSSSGVSAAQIDGWAVPTGWQNVRWQQNYGVDNKIKFWAQGDPEPSGWTLIQTTTGQTAGVYSSFSVDVQGDSTMTSDFEVWYDALNVPDLNRCTAVHLDDFEGRTVSPGWGTSSSGPVWNPSAHANTSVSSGIGTLDLRGLGNPTTGALVEKVVAPSILPVTLHDVWRTNRNYTDVPYISTGNNNENYWNFENSGGSETIRVDFQYWSNGTHSIHAVLLVISRIGSGTTFAQQIFTDSSAAAALFGGSPVVTSLLPRAVANTWYERKIRLTNGVGVQWKIWESGTTEPDWTTSTVIVPNNFSLNDASLQLANPGSGTNSTNDLLYETQYIDLGAETPCADVPPADPVNAVISGKTCTDFDGGTDTFQLPNDVYSGTVEVYVNGLLQPLSEVTSSTTGLIVLSYTTASTDKVRICYEIRDFNK